MKKVFSALALLSILVFPALASAQTILEECNVTHVIRGNIDCPQGPSNVAICCTLNFVATVGDWIFAFVLVIATIFFVIGGFKFVTSGGSPEGVTAARAMILYGVVGVAVAFLAQGLVGVVQNVVGG